MRPRTAPHVPPTIRVQAAYWFWDHEAELRALSSGEREAYLSRLERQDRRKARAMRSLFERHL